VLDDAAVLLLRSRQETRHVDERDERDVEAIAEPHEARGLRRRVDIEAAREVARLIRDDADRAAFEAREAAHDVLRVVLVDFAKALIVDDGEDDLLDVVRLVRIERHERIE